MYVNLNDMLKPALREFISAPDTRYYALVQAFINLKILGPTGDIISIKTSSPAVRNTCYYLIGSVLLRLNRPTQALRAFLSISQGFDWSAIDVETVTTDLDSRSSTVMLPGLTTKHLQALLTVDCEDKAAVVAILFSTKPNLGLTETITNFEMLVSIVTIAPELTEQLRRKNNIADLVHAVDEAIWAKSPDTVRSGFGKLRPASSTQSTQSTVPCDYSCIRKQAEIISFFEALIADADTDKKDKMSVEKLSAYIKDAPDVLAGILNDLQFLETCQLADAISNRKGSHTHQQALFGFIANNATVTASWRKMVNMNVDWPQPSNLETHHCTPAHRHKVRTQLYRISSFYYLAAHSGIPDAAYRLARLFKGHNTKILLDSINTLFQHNFATADEAAMFFDQKALAEGSIVYMQALNETYENEEKKPASSWPALGNKKQNSHTSKLSQLCETVLGRADITADERTQAQTIQAKLPSVGSSCHPGTQIAMEMK